MLPKEQILQPTHPLGSRPQFLLILLTEPSPMTTELISGPLVHASIYKIILDVDTQKSSGEIEWDIDGAGRAAVVSLPQEPCYPGHFCVHSMQDHCSKFKSLFWQQGSDSLEESEWALLSLNLKKVLCIRVTDPGDEGVSGAKCTFNIAWVRKG